MYPLSYLLAGLSVVCHWTAVSELCLFCPLLHTQFHNAKNRVDAMQGFAEQISKQVNLV